MLRYPTLSQSEKVGSPRSPQDSGVSSEPSPTGAGTLGLQNTPLYGQALSVRSYPGGQLDHRQPLRRDLGTNHEPPLWPGQGVASEDITRMDEQDGLPQRRPVTAGGSSCPQ